MSYTMCVYIETFSHNWVDNLWFHPIIKVAPLIAKATNFDKSQPSFSNKKIKQWTYFLLWHLDSQQLKKKSHLRAFPLKTQITTINYQCCFMVQLVDSSTRMEYTWDIKALACNILLKCLNNAHKNSGVAFDVWAPYSSLMGIKECPKVLKIYIHFHYSRWNDPKLWCKKNLYASNDSNM